MSAAVMVISLLPLRFLRYVIGIAAAFIAAAYAAAATLCDAAIELMPDTPRHAAPLFFVIATPLLPLLLPCHAAPLFTYLPCR